MVKNAGFPSYAAHIVRDKNGNVLRVQTVKEHCENVSRLAAEFAKPFGAEDTAAMCGLAHDIGKYSDAFQDRIWNGASIVDHASAGAIELKKLRSLAFPCVAGHHTGLQDIQYLISERLRNPVEPYDAYKSEFTLSNTKDAGFLFRKDTMLPAFAVSFYIRMLFSCLVDADRLDTEAFMTGVQRDHRQQDIDGLLDSFMSFVGKKGWLNGKTGLNLERSRILKRCLDYGRTAHQGLYTLTVPTGGGKTGASLAFALRHAKEHGMKRVIFVVPYCAIIDQTVGVYKEILGEENVLAHYSEASFVQGEETGRSAAENWDAPVIVTTAVQFFESLFSNRPEKCRKLHNIADSVIIFDEAQTMPVDFLKPCVCAIAELVAHYHATCVLCTATQPSLDPFIRAYLPSADITEICEQPETLYRAFRRVSYRDIGTVSQKELVRKLSAHDQVLCIVQTRRQAREIFERMPADGTFHLSTWMTPEHRKETLAAIRERLQNGQPCRVIATSLIEAGVDLDFPVVFRALSGLDSIIQAGGRCNREGKRDVGTSIVYIFRLPDWQRMPAALTLPAETTESILQETDDIANPDSVRRYFNELYYIRGNSLDREHILDKLAPNNTLFQFETAADSFKLIEDRGEKKLLIPRSKESLEFAKELTELRTADRGTYRKAGRFCVSVPSDTFEKLCGRIDVITDDLAVLNDPSIYNTQTGLCLE